MRIDTKKLKRLLLLNFPYIFVGLIATNLGEGWRLAEEANSSEKLLSFMTTLPVALDDAADCTAESAPQLSSPGSSDRPWVRGGAQTGGVPEG